MEDFCPLEEERFLNLSFGPAISLAIFLCLATFSFLWRRELLQRRRSQIPLAPGAIKDQPSVESTLYDGDDGQVKSTLRVAPPPLKLPETGFTEGHHSILFSDGTSYSGQWHNGSMQGRGVFLWPSGDRYEGEWEDGLQHGQGTFAAANGSVYFGGWAQGCMDGRGVYKPPPPTTLVYLRTYAHGKLVQEVSLRVDDVDPVRKAQMKEQRRRAAPGAGGARPLQPGEVVYKGHHSFDLMRQLQMGIMYSVAQAGLGGASYVLSAEDFRSESIQYFPAGSAGETPAFKWKDYAPRAFQQLREMFGIDSADYLVSLTGGPALRELPSPGASGCIFFLSSDDRFLIKSVRKEEMELLLGLVRRYHAHVASNPVTVLVRFFGIHRVSPWLGRNARFLVMGNVLPTDRRMHRKYDLKGSTYKRTVGEAKRATDSGATLKDLDIDLKFELSPDRHKRLISQLVADTEFLERLHVIDYSLLLGVHFVRWGESDWYPPYEDWPEPPAEDGNDQKNALGHQGSMAGALLVETLQGLSTAGMLEPGLSRTAADVIANADSVRLAARISAAAARSLEGTPSQLSLSNEQHPLPDLVGLGAPAAVAMGSSVSSFKETRRRTIRASDEENGIGWAIPAIAIRRTASGGVAREPVLLYFGIIDFLQKYNTRKRLEHAWKSSLHGAAVSVADPHHYAQRFLHFMQDIFVVGGQGPL